MCIRDSVNVVKLLTTVSAWWHLAGAAIIIGVLFFVPKHHQPLDWTFTAFVNNTGWASPIYAVLIGLLMAQYTFTGFDASAHVAEAVSYTHRDVYKRQVPPLYQGLRQAQLTGLRLARDGCVATRHLKR